MNSVRIHRGFGGGRQHGAGRDGAEHALSGAFRSDAPQATKQHHVSHALVEPPAIRNAQRTIGQHQLSRIRPPRSRIHQHEPARPLHFYKDHQFHHVDSLNHPDSQ